jgi:hypothetical protein
MDGRVKPGHDGNIRAISLNTPPAARPPQTISIRPIYKDDEDLSILSLPRALVVAVPFSFMPAMTSSPTPTILGLYGLIISEAIWQSEIRYS